MTKGPVDGKKSDHMKHLYHTVQISQVEIFRWSSIILILKRCDPSNQFERTPEREYQGQNMNSFVIIFRFNTTWWLNSKRKKNIILCIS
jgi:hypothetical protein